MSPTLQICFWALAAGVIYTYALYPLIVAIIAKWRGRPVRSIDPVPRSVSIVVAAYNEQATIGRRVDELVHLLLAGGLEGEVIVVSDGSTDRTATIASQRAGPVKVLALSCNVGKAAALNAGHDAAAFPIVVLADARQMLAADALTRLLGPFSDPAVGAVSGELVIESSPGVMAGIGLYWCYEKWLRHREAQVHSTVGVSGAICAVRRELFTPIPAGTVLDDVYWPLRVVMQGYRVVHESRAIAYDRLPEHARDEFRRKVRTLSSNFQLVARLPSAALPWRNPIWAQFISHKLMRLAVPWALIGLLILSAILPGTVYRVAFWSQIGFYALALLGIWTRLGSRTRLAAAAASFVVLNSAAWVGFWVWLVGGASRSWKKVSYPAAAPANPAEDLEEVEMPA